MGRATLMDMTLKRIQGQAATQTLRVTQHAQKEMDAEEITLDEVLMAIAKGQILLSGLVQHKGERNEM